MAALSGKVVIVTGASRGIGAAAAEALAAAGAAVMLTARDGKLAAEVAGQIEAAGGKTAALACDVADYAAVEALVAATTQRFGRPAIRCPPNERKEEYPPAPNQSQSRHISYTKSSPCFCHTGNSNRARYSITNKRSLASTLSPTEASFWVTLPSTGA